MSFSLNDRDQSAALGEVLVFIDTFEFGESDAVLEAAWNSLPNDNGDGGVSPSNVGVSRQRNKRRRQNLSSSTRLQQSKKAEILYLRKCVLELEEQMQRLKGQSGCPFHRLPPIDPNTTWRELAEANYSARLRAEEENRALKRLVANQLRSSGVVRALLEQQLAVQVDLHQHSAALSLAST